MLLNNQDKVYYIDENGDGSGVTNAYGNTVEPPTPVFVVNQPTVIADTPAITQQQPTLQTTTAPTDQVQQTTTETTPLTATTPANVVSDAQTGNKMLVIAIVVIVVVATGLFIIFKRSK